MNKQRRRCPNGTRRNPITDECDPKPDPMAPKQRKTRSNKGKSRGPYKKTVSEPMAPKQRKTRSNKGKPRGPYKKTVSEPMAPKQLKTKKATPMGIKKVRQTLKKAQVLGKRVALKEESDFQKKIAHLNTTTYRTKYKSQRLKSNAFKQKERLLSKSGEFFLPDKVLELFSKIKIISRPENSASGSLVFLLKSKEQQFIMKITAVSQDEVSQENMPATEAKLYELMEIFVKKQITPHVFMIIDSLYQNVSKHSVNPAFMKTILNKNNLKADYYYPIIIETADPKVKVITLNEFISTVLPKIANTNTVHYIMLNLMFQIFYTLLCFEEVQFKHNDLHFKNIFVLEREDSILNDPKKVPGYVREYNYKDINGKMVSTKLPYIGLDIRIYDFDRSVKQSNKFKPFPQRVESKFLKNYYIYGQNGTDNPYADAYKFLCTMYFKSNVSKSLKSLILRFFYYKKTMLEKYYYIDKKGNKVMVETPYKYRYYLLKDTLPDGVMFKNTEILSHLDKLLKNPKIKDFSPGRQVIESFSSPSIFYY